MPRALKDLLIACGLTLLGVAAGFLLAGSARAEPAQGRPACPMAGESAVGVDRSQWAAARLHSEQTDVSGSRTDGPHDARRPHGADLPER